MKKNEKHRSFICTWNNPDISLEETKTKAIDTGAISFVGQPEVGASNTAHYQFCFQFPNPRSFMAVKQVFPKAHIEPC